jgi:hypothetical protein
MMPGTIIFLNGKLPSGGSLMLRNRQVFGIVYIEAFLKSDDPADHGFEKAALD